MKTQQDPCDFLVSNTHQTHMLFQAIGKVNDLLTRPFVIVP